jgi:L-ascorbate metabolism protein UlaG (beta-lactamase superfamily)
MIPMHYNTFDLISQDAKSFASRVKRAAPKTRVVVLKPGESFAV